MAFRFNFQNAESSTSSEKLSSTNSEKEQSAHLPLEQAREICPSSNDDHYNTKVILVSKENVFTVVDSGQVECHLREFSGRQPLVQALESQSDLVPNVYEGGLKIWECSFDLVNYLSSLQIAFQGLKVLELGCGAGLPGIWSLLAGAEVHFQDYNKEVIELVTVPNVELNTDMTSVGDRCKFFSGDWGCLQQHLLNSIQSDTDKYDMILTSETIYCLESQDKLLALMKSVLKSTGTVYLAAKTHYFGVGGGTRQFEDKVVGHGDFSIKVAAEFMDGLQREILEMKLKLKDENS